MLLSATVDTTLTAEHWSGRLSTFFCGKLSSVLRYCVEVVVWRTTIIGKMSKGVQDTSGSNIQLPMWYKRFRPLELKAGLGIGETYALCTWSNWGMHRSDEIAGPLCRFLLRRCTTNVDWELVVKLFGWTPVVVKATIVATANISWQTSTKRQKGTAFQACVVGPLQYERN